MLKNQYIADSVSITDLVNSGYPLSVSPTHHEYVDFMHRANEICSGEGKWSRCKRWAQRYALPGPGDIHTSQFQHKMLLALAFISISCNSVLKLYHVFFLKHFLVVLTSCSVRAAKNICSREWKLCIFLSWSECSAECLGVRLSVQCRARGGLPSGMDFSSSCTTGEAK